MLLLFYFLFLEIFPHNCSSGVYETNRWFSEYSGIYTWAPLTEFIMKLRCHWEEIHQSNQVLIAKATVTSAHTTVNIYKADNIHTSINVSKLIQLFRARCFMTYCNYFWKSLIYRRNSAYPCMSVFFMLHMKTDSETGIHQSCFLFLKQIF